MTNLFQSPADLGEYLFRITDNGGATADRYTVIFSDGDYLSLSEYPSSPVGVSQWGEHLDVNHLDDRIEAGRERDIRWRDLPAHIREHVLSRCNEGWRDFMELGESDDLKAVAPDRESATACEGSYTDAGNGIYRTQGGYMVKQDGGPDDRGPFDTFREAMLATLPDIHGLSGPEYHAPDDMWEGLTPWSPDDVTPTYRSWQKVGGPARLADLPDDHGLAITETITPNGERQFIYWKTAQGFAGPYVILTYREPGTNRSWSGAAFTVAVYRDSALLADMLSPWRRNPHDFDDAWEAGQAIRVGLELVCLVDPRPEWRSIEESA